MLAEWALRAFDIERLPYTDPALYRLDDELDYTMVPNARVYSHGAWFETDRHGIRGPSWAEARREGHPVVLFLGDSVTAGFGVDADETLVRKRLARLRDPGSRRELKLNG